MHIPYSHESIRLTGRWDTRDPHAAITTTTGAYLEFAFIGRMAVARFDTFAQATPHLHLWIEIDGGARIEVPIDRYLRIVAPTDGVHVCRIIYKGGIEQARRWYPPLTGRVSFVGIQTEKPAILPLDNRPLIEFVGDSITQGVKIDMDYATPEDINPCIDQTLRVYSDDACATYAWLTAEALNLRPIMMGYGSVGVTRSGQGKVPAAGIAYPYNFDGSPISHRGKVKYVVINHGANDRAKPAELYLDKYAELLDIIREYQPQATIVALSPFYGVFRHELCEMITSYNQTHHTNIHYIDGGAWISPEPLHPLREGHRVAADHLIKAMREFVQ